MTVSPFLDVEEFEQEAMRWPLTGMAISLRRQLNHSEINVGERQDTGCGRSEILGQCGRSFPALTTRFRSLRYRRLRRRFNGAAASEPQVAGRLRAL